jgi:zinc/manganese transport system permease protein
MNWQSLDWVILGPALCAGLLVLSTHVALGRLVLARGIIFIDLAIAQIAGLGMLFAQVLHWENGWPAQIAAAVAALAGAALLSFTERRWPEIQEALIGILFVLAASAAILLVSHHPHGGEQLRDLLAGQILWVSYAQLLPTLILYVVIIAGLIWQARRGAHLLFYPLFALAVTASVQLVGVYLVFASLIVPAVAVRKLKGKIAIVTGLLLGGASYALGLMVSALFDLPSGPVIVLMLAALGIIFLGIGAKTSVSTP